MAVAFDEMNGLGEDLRPAYQELSRWLKETPPDALEYRRQEAELLFRRIGITFAVYGDSEAQERLTILEAEGDGFRVAEEDLRRTIRWAEIAGQGGWLSQTYRFLAEAFLGQGKVAEALAAARRALTLSQEVESPPLLGSAWRVVGMVLAVVGEGGRGVSK